MVLIGLFPKEKARKFIRDSIGKIAELQQLIENFVQYLLDISDHINSTVRRFKFVYDTVKDKESVADPMVKKVH